MVLPLVPLAIGGAALAASGSLAGIQRRQTNRRQLNTDRSDIPRGYQMDMLGQLQRSASGFGPSYADLQMRQTMEEGRKQAASQAASARGGNIALAQRAGANQSAAITGDIAGQAGAARLEEMMINRQLAQQQAGMIRSADMDQEQANMEAKLAWDRMELERKQRNRDRIASSLQFAGAAMGNMASGK